jgi:hypothetical protein
MIAVGSLCSPLLGLRESKTHDPARARRGVGRWLSRRGTPRSAPEGAEARGLRPALPPRRLLLPPRRTRSSAGPGESSAHGSLAAARERFATGTLERWCDERLLRSARGCFTGFSNPCAELREPPCGPERASAATGCVVLSASLAFAAWQRGLSLLAAGGIPRGPFSRVAGAPTRF